MLWNWQQPAWPDFTWNAARLARAEERFLLNAGVLVGAVSHVDSTERDMLTVESISTEAVTTSEIEGEMLDRESVQSSVRRALGFSVEPRRSRPREQGISELMVDLYRGYAAPLTHETLFTWHRMVMAGRFDLRDVGQYRTYTDPMQVVSGPIHAPNVHFEAPPSSRVPDEMRRFIDWFNNSGPRGRHPLTPVTRAGLAHLYFESIHPFEDGNGRIGRAVSEMALAQALERPSLTALAATILIRQREYYDALEAANKGNDVTEWLAWFAGMAIEAQLRTLAQVRFLIDKSKLLDRYRDQLKERQITVLLRVLREGPDGFKGGLSAGKYVAIAKTSPATAGRDLADMVEKGALTRTGEKKHTRYYPDIALRPVPRVTVDARGEVVESSQHA